MRRCTSLGPLVAALALGVGLAGTATARPPGRPPGPGMRFEQSVERLGLDEETLAKAYEILDASRAQHRALRAQLREAHETMRSLLDQSEPNETAVMEQADAIGALETQAHKQRLGTMLEVRALLTPEQRARLLEMMWDSRRHGRRGRGWGRLD